ncbi:MAG TPA: RodZ domain-containing protein [Gaiellaceae bacterium]|jgi:hypothetical protein|nr:RodZ domain-containing protein [Gaiellaceae bacterium]
MIEVGGELQRARERGGFALEDVERHTHIRARYLEALEREQFDSGPERAYMRAFLVEYADFVELESGPLVEEFDRRFPAEPPPVFVFVEPSRRPIVVAALALGVLLVGIGALVQRDHTPPPPPSFTLRPSRPPIPITHRVIRRAQPRVRSKPGLLLVARGPCWVEAHTGGMRGGARVLYRTLRPGERVRLRGHRFWLRLGAPRNLEAFVGGRRLTLPRKTGNLVVRARTR